MSNFILHRNGFAAKLAIILLCDGCGIAMARSLDVLVGALLSEAPKFTDKFKEKFKQKLIERIKTEDDPLREAFYDLALELADIEVRLNGKWPRSLSGSLASRS